jgi:hypothetical protein
MSIERKRGRIVAALAAAGLWAPLAGLAAGFPGGVRDALGPGFGASEHHARGPKPPPPTLDAVHRWNSIAIDASGLDHTPVAPGESRSFGEQYGPPRAARAMAIVHIAIQDAVNAIVPGHQGYTGLRSAPPGASLDAAVAKAAHDTLAALFPSQAATFDAALAEDLAQLGAARGATARGLAVGRRAAAAILALRRDDGSDHAEPRIGIEFVPGDEPGDWQQDPISRIPLALGALWGGVRPFAMTSSDQFRTPPPPPLESAEYATAFDEVKGVGGDGIATPTARTAEQTEIGIYWAYDGTPSLCAPPRLYNQLAVTIADQMGSDEVELARLLALVNVAMADAAIAVWESKYHYQLWRPVTGIREADGDGNDATIADPGFSPLGAPASNLAGPNFTPPFPAYPSGHAGFGGAVFQVLRRFYGTDDVAFAFVSDEFNGVTVDNQGNVRPLVQRRFASFSEAEEENGQSRIYLGIHWAFDKSEGIAQGRRVGDWVVDHAFRPLP